MEEIPPPSQARPKPEEKAVPKFVFKLRRNLQKKDRVWHDAWRKFRRHTLPHYRRVILRFPRTFVKVLWRSSQQMRSGIWQFRKHVRSEMSPVRSSDSIYSRALPPGETFSAAAYHVRPIIHGDPASQASVRVLVVGGMDFFGAALVKCLNASGVTSVTLADHLGDDRWRNLPHLKFEDFLSLEELSEMLARPKLLGSFSHVFYLDDWEGNNPLDLPKRLLVGLSENGGGKFVSLSCASSLGFTPDRAAAREGRWDALRPVTRSGVMANLFDRFASRRLAPAQYLALKHYRLFGPNERSNGSLYGLAKRAYEEINATGEVHLSAALKPDCPEGMRRHDMLYIKDAARMSVCLALGTASGIHELGAGTSVTALKVVQEVFAAMGKEPKILWVERDYISPSSQPEQADMHWLQEYDDELSPWSLERAMKDYVQNHLKTGHLVSEAEEPASIAVASPSSVAKALPGRKKAFQAKH